MERKRLIPGILAVAVLVAAGVARADVSVSIDISPPPVLVAAPPVVVVPGTPVHHVPTVDFNLFVHDGRYYSFHNGHWFVAVRLGSPWVPVVVQNVPRAVLAVPVNYYKVPPGHARKMRGGPPAGPPGHTRGPRGGGRGPGN